MTVRPSPRLRQPWMVQHGSDARLRVALAIEGQEEIAFLDFPLDLPGLLMLSAEVAAAAANVSRELGRRHRANEPEPVNDEPLATSQPSLSD